MEVGSLAKLVANVDIEEPQEACPPETPPETQANQEPEASKESHLDNDVTGEVRLGTCPPEAQTNQDQGAELQDDGEANSPEEVQSCMPEPEESADKESVSKESADPYPKPVEHMMPPKRKAPDTKDKQDDPLERVIPVLETLIGKLDELNQTSQQMFQAQQQLRVEFQNCAILLAEQNQYQQFRLQYDDTIHRAELQALGGQQAAMRGAKPSDLAKPAASKPTQ